MSSTNPQTATSQVVQVHWADRWEVYHRLQALEIPCQCAIDRPLEVELDNPRAAIALWSVVRQITAPRYELICWLDTCWQLETSSPDN